MLLIFAKKPDALPPGARSTITDEAVFIFSVDGRKDKPTTIQMAVDSM